MDLLKIDVTLIDKARLFHGKPKADGRVPKYYSLNVVELKTPDKFGNTLMVVESIPKEERLAGKKGTILGSGKSFKRRSSPTPSEPAPGADTPDPDDVPF
jgi:hypothetical protein